MVKCVLIELEGYTQVYISILDAFNFTQLRPLLVAIVNGTEHNLSRDFPL